jgi:hypothetical protein
MLIIRQGTRIVAGIALLAMGNILLANPSHQDFDAALAVHGRTSSPEIQQRAQALYESANEALIGFAKALNTSRGVQLDGKKIGRTHLELLQLARLGGRLVLLGEPAGVDYQRRSAVLKQNLNKVVTAYQSTRGGQAFIQSIRQQLARQTPVRARTLRQVQELAQQGKWPQAENALYDLLDMLETGTVFLTSNEWREIYDPFEDVRQAVDRAMLKLRYDQAREELATRREAETPDFEGVAAQMLSAAQALNTSTTVPWEGDSLTGPELVDRFGQKWQELQVMALRCRALDWAMQQRGTDMYEMEGDFEGEPVDRLRGPMKQFQGSVAQAVAQAIDADAARASAEDAAVLYVEYLKVLAPLVRQAERGLADVVEPPLQKLASQGGNFAQEVVAYQAATDELLRWRRRVASGRAAARASAYPSLEKPFFEATRSKDEYRGLFPERDADPRTPALQASAPQVMPVAIERLMGQTVAAHDVVRVPGQSRTAIGRYRVRTYASVPIDLPLENELDALRYDLLAGDQAPPLSLAAMQSLLTAEGGDFVTVGGTIRGLHLESLITRFASLPTPAAVLLPLGVLPREDTDEVEDYDLRSQMLMRFDLQPQWVQHDHFFAELATDASADQ